MMNNQKIRAGKYDNYKVIDLAEVNDIRTDTELIEMYDEFWDMFHLGELDKYCGCKPSNGYHIISGVDIKDKITLELSLFQREMVEDVLYAVVTEYCEGDFLLRKDKNLDIKNLVDQVLHTKRAKKKFKNWQLDRTAN